MLKAVNSHKSSSFQQFKDDIIKSLPQKPVIQDLDLIRLAGNDIKYLIEVKKSFSPDWVPYIKRLKPYKDYSQLDDFNYKALFKLASKIPAEAIIFYYVTDNLTKYGIKPFRLLNIDLDLKCYRFYNQQEIVEYLKDHSDETSGYLKDRNLDIFKDQRNPNIKNDEQNIYAWLAKDLITRGFYYVESDGVWTMLMSDGATYEPIWLYIELNTEVANIPLDPSELLHYFKPQIQIHQTTDVPFSIICYNNSLDEFSVYHYDIDNFILQKMSKTEFIAYYSCFVQKATSSK